MTNRENIYLLAKLLGMIIELEKDGVVSYYKFIDGKLYKIIKP